MNPNKWVMLPESYQPDTADSRADSGLKYAKYYHESAYEELKAQLEDHMPFDAYYLNWEVERGLLLAEIDSLKAIDPTKTKLRNNIKKLQECREKLLSDLDHAWATHDTVKSQLAEAQADIEQLKLMTESYRVKLSNVLDGYDNLRIIESNGLARMDAAIEEVRKALEQK